MGKKEITYMVLVAIIVACTLASSVGFRVEGWQQEVIFGVTGFCIGVCGLLIAVINCMTFSD